jgi:hypothetical protein
MRRVFCNGCPEIGSTHGTRLHLPLYAAFRTNKEVTNKSAYSEDHCMFLNTVINTERTEGKSIR